MDLEILAVMAGLIFSFLFSASETALTALGRLEIETIKASGGASAKLIKHWTTAPNKILTQILVGNNIANVVASSLFTLWVRNNYENSLALLMAIFTIILILFVEIVPKLAARQWALKVAPYSLRFLQSAGLVLAPLVFVVHKLSARIARVSAMPGRRPFSESELSHTIKIATIEGGIDQETGEVLENLMDFPDTIARDIMLPRSEITALPVNYRLDDVINEFKKTNYSRYPVVRKSLDDVLGILLSKDLLKFVHKGGSGSWTKIVRKPVYVSELAPLGTILRDMKRTGIHMVLVRNETGIVTGLLTFEDLIEEIVGEIRDEHDAPSEAGGNQAMGGPVFVDGQTSIVDFNHRYDKSLPLDLSYSTLNGYLLSRMDGLLPKHGTIIFDDDVTFRIHSVSKNGIAKVELIDHTAASDDS